MEPLFGEEEEDSAWIDLTCMHAFFIFLLFSAVLGEGGEKSWVGKEKFFPREFVKKEKSRKETFSPGPDFSF